MFYAQLQSLCAERGVKVTPLTEELGISRGAIKGWKSGSSPTGETLSKFADYFGVSVDWLLGREATNEDESDAEFIEMPVFEERASAGGGEPLYGDGAVEFVGFSREDVPADATHGVYISGDSMEPRIKDGQLVWLALDEPVEDGEIGLFVRNGEGFCKKLRVDYDNGKAFLVSLNPKYRAIKLNEDDEFKTVARVLI